MHFIEQAAILSMLTAVSLAHFVPRSTGNYVGLDLFHQDNCVDQFMSISVPFDQCYVAPVGFSSYRINHDGSGDKGNKITVYSKANCGCPTCGSHGYNDVKGKGDGCGKNFGFVANAVGYFDPEAAGELIYAAGDLVSNLNPPKRDFHHNATEEIEHEYEHIHDHEEEDPQVRVEFKA